MRNRYDHYLFVKGMIIGTLLSVCLYFAVFIVIWWILK